jgi:hypothetical protein
MAANMNVKEKKVARVARVMVWVVTVPVTVVIVVGEVAILLLLLLRLRLLNVFQQLHCQSHHCRLEHEHQFPLPER